VTGQRRRRAVDPAHETPSASRDRGRTYPLGRRRDQRAWLVGAAGLAIGLTIALRVLIPAGMDPTVFLALGEDSPIPTGYAQRLLGDVTMRRDLGHDGRFFFAQANDPWFLEPEVHAVVLDRPMYRAERMLFPMVAGGLGLFPPSVVVWAMLVTNLLAITIGAILAARLAAGGGAAPWLGLWVPLNIGVLFELDIGGAGILAYTCCLGATYALVKDRIWLASTLFAAAALSREVMVAYAAGVFILWWYDRGRSLWPIIVAPLAAMAAWTAYVWFRLNGIQGTGGNTGNFGLPFVGFAEALRAWIQEPLNLLVSLVLLAVLVAFVPLALRRRLPVAWGALPFAGLVVVLSANVLREPFDFSRAILPVFTALPFLIMVPRREGVSMQADQLTGEPA
jgi:hypothetical protein